MSGKMTCPVCKTTKLRLQELEERLTPHKCESCGGRLVRLERYLLWLQRTGGAVSEVDPPDAEITVDDSGPGKLCPSCGAFLVRHKVGHGVSFCVDRCGRCGDIWLDGGEWELLKVHGLHDDLHRIFSNAWQREVKQQERSEQYRRTVERVLSDKLAVCCSDADVTKVRRFCAWLDTHPQRNELFAFVAAMREW